MPAAKKVYPDWVQAYRTKGMTVKMKGDSYYLYKRTSRRVPGKKYPQPVDTYVGIITPEGVVKTNRKRVTLTDIEVYEYGYSRAVWELCPESWKKPLGEDWEEVLKIILKKQSPQSYLCRDGVKEEKEFRYQLPAQTASLSRRIYKAYGVNLEELEELKTIYQLIIDGKEVLSKISPGQKELIEKLGLLM